ncbi:hypothetical protein Tco_1059683 [Tanacetum coccineum]
MSATVIEELITQRVADALADYEANRNSRNENHNGNGSHDSGSDGGSVRPPKCGIYSGHGSRGKGLKRQKEAKTVKNRQETVKRQKESRARQRNQSEITAGSARHSQTQSKIEIKKVKKSNYKSRGQLCQVFKDSRAYFEDRSFKGQSCQRVEVDL